MELDLHWKDEDTDLGIASEGVLCDDMEDIINRITEVKDTVRIINLENQPALTEIPEILKECKLLEELDISHTDIDEIPEFLFKLPNLKSLSCRCSFLSQPPKGFSNARKLERLHCRINKGWTFFDEILSLENLKYLGVDLYSPIMLPKKLGTLKNIEEFFLAIKYDEEGDVSPLPDSFNEHPVLKTVIIDDPFHKTRKTFDLESAAKILSTCPKLETLELTGLAVGAGHHNLSILTGLKELKLRHLLVSGNILDSIASLQNLEKLDIWGSEFKLTKIPDIFINMKNLQDFSFAGNMVLDLPPSIYGLTELRTLGIGSTGISTLNERIGNLKNLKRLDIYDNLLSKLPDAVFTLPSLEILNIEENIFNPKDLFAISEKIKNLAQKGHKIEFLYKMQGHRQWTKKLRAIRDIDKVDVENYFRLCLNASRENPFAIKYMNKDKLHDQRLYAELCIISVRKTCVALENVDPKKLGDPYYFLVCMEAARDKNIGNNFKLIKDDELSNDEFIQVCMEAAMHNASFDFIRNFNTEAFSSRFGREIYERICWVSVLHNPHTAAGMIKPTAEIRKIVERRTRKKQTR